MGGIAANAYALRLLIRVSVHLRHITAPAAVVAEWGTAGRALGLVAHKTPRYAEGQPACFQVIDTRPALTPCPLDRLMDYSRAGGIWARRLTIAWWVGRGFLLSTAGRRVQAVCARGNAAFELFFGPPGLVCGRVGERACGRGASRMYGEVFAGGWLGGSGSPDRALVVRRCPFDCAGAFGRVLFRGGGGERRLPTGFLRRDLILAGFDSMGLPVFGRGQLPEWRRWLWGKGRKLG